MKQKNAIFKGIGVNRASSQNIFIILTLYKAYYIVWAFMHMEGETTILRRSVVWTAIFLIIYLVFIFSFILGLLRL